MTDQEEVPQKAPAGKSDRVDNVLRIVVIALVAAVLSAGGFFGYTIWEARRAESLATPAQRALASLKQSVTRDPNNAALRVRYGEALASVGLYDPAKQQFEAAIEIDENHTGAWLDLGLVAMQVNDRAAAQKYFDKVIELTEGAQFENVNQRRELALFYLGEIALDERRYEDAATNFKAALRIRRDSSTTYYLLAQAFNGMGSDDSAMENLDAALAFDPNYPEAHYLYGQILLRKDDRINAAIHLRRAADLAPDVKDPKDRLAELGTADEAVERSKVALADKRTAEALDEALLARALDPQNIEAGLAHARAALAKNENDAARSALEDVLKLDEQNAEAKRLLAGLGD
jgi:tetratricopeptide (TPR) repeat protein